MTLPGLRIWAARHGLDMPFLSWWRTWLGCLVWASLCINGLFFFLAIFIPHPSSFSSFFFSFFFFHHRTTVTQRQQLSISCLFPFFLLSCLDIPAVFHFGIFHILEVGGRGKGSTKLLCTILVVMSNFGNASERVEERSWDRVIGKGWWKGGGGRKRNTLPPQCNAFAHRSLSSFSALMISCWYVSRFAFFPRTSRDVIRFSKQLRVSHPSMPLLLSFTVSIHVLTNHWFLHKHRRPSKITRQESPYGHKHLPRTTIDINAKSLLHLPQV